MRHAKRPGKLGRTSAHRKAMLRNMVTSLMEHERVETTHAKARELRRIADRVITLGKRGDLHARRRALQVLQDKSVTAKVFSDLADRFRERPGGYTRVTKVRQRLGDAAPLSIVQLVDGPDGAPAPKRAKADTTRRARKKKADEGAEEKTRGSRARKGRGGGEPKGRGRKGSEAKTAPPKGAAAKTRRSSRRKTD